MRHALLPADPDDEQLARGWTLSEEDLVEVHRCRGDHMRFSFALQLCTGFREQAGEIQRTWSRWWCVPQRICGIRDGAPVRGR